VLPFFIGLLAVIVLKETITPLVIFGGVVVFASTLLVTVYEAEILLWIGGRKGGVPQP
jgi:drug/metabolite transporter (DMT)-like permease